MMSTKTGMTFKELFIFKNDLSDAEFEFLMFRKQLKLKTLGEVKMPNGEIKNIKK